MISAALLPLLALVPSSIQVGGLTRTYELYVPSELDRSRPVPLVLVLHGAGGTGRRLAPAVKFEALADQKRFIVVYPDGYEKHWNDGRGIPEWTSHIKDVDDVGFLSALIDKLIATQNADPHRVYVTGISNGGLMSHRLGCELAGKVAAIAPVVRTFTTKMAEGCRPSRPIPVLMFFGTADRQVPFEGGIQKMGSAATPVLSARETIEKWASLDGCPLKPPLADKVELQCSQGSEVVAYILEGAGHSWPKDATQIIWNFFAKHALK